MSSAALRPGLESLNKVFDYYKHAATDFEVELWLALMNEVGDEAIVSFLKNHVRSSAFSPKISEAMALLRPGANNSAAAFLALTQAVGTVGAWEAPRFNDPAITKAVLELGGWAKVCATLPAPEERFEYEGFQKRFAVAYQIAAADIALNGAPQHLALAGFHAITREQLALAADQRAALVAPPARESGGGA